MNNEHFDPYESSEQLDQAKESAMTAQELDKMIVEAEEDLRGAQEFKKETLEYNELAKENGFTEEDLTTINQHIAKLELVITRCQKLRDEFTSLAGDFESLHEKYKQLLLNHESKTAVN